jgi:CBS-domain-containing membrane protein
MLTATDVMTADVISVGPDKPVRDIAAILYTQRISGVPVIDESKAVIGIVSEGDLIGHAAVSGERRRSWWLSLFEDETYRRGITSRRMAAPRVM